MKTNVNLLPNTSIGTLDILIDLYVVLITLQDALIGANLQKMDFAMSNVLVVPYESDSVNIDRQMRPEGGFGGRPSYELQPFVARPVGDGWDDLIGSEMADAVEQNGPRAAEEGIALVVANTGKIIRRGVGKVPWRQMVEQLQQGTEAIV